MLNSTTRSTPDKDRSAGEVILRALQLHDQSWARSEPQVKSELHDQPCGHYPSRPRQAAEWWCRRCFHTVIEPNCGPPTSFGDVDFRSGLMMVGRITPKRQRTARVASATAGIQPK